jgi:hypothetical protein
MRVDVFREFFVITAQIGGGLSTCWTLNISGGFKHPRQLHGNSGAQR